MKPPTIQDLEDIKDMAQDIIFNLSIKSEQKRKEILNSEIFTKDFHAVYSGLTLMHKALEE